MADRTTFDALEPHVGATRAAHSDAPRRATDAATWLALGLLVAVVLAFTTRDAEHGAGTGKTIARHSAHSVTHGTQIALGNSSRVTGPRNSATRAGVARVALPRHAARTTNSATASTVSPSTVSPSTVSPRTVSPNHAHRATAVPAIAARTGPSATARHSPSFTVPHIEVASMTMPGTLRYPDDVATRYAFTTSGGQVSARLSTTGHIRLTLRLECTGVRTRRSGQRIVSLGASVPGGSCSLLVSAPAIAGSSTTSYRLLVHFPAEIP